MGKQHTHVCPEGDGSQLPAGTQLPSHVGKHSLLSLARRRVWHTELMGCAFCVVGRGQLAQSPRVFGSEALDKGGDLLFAVHTKPFPRISPIDLSPTAGVDITF